MLFTLDNMSLELMAPSGAGANADRIRSVLAAQGEGLASLCFRTDDIAKMHRRLDRLTLKPEPVAEVESRDAIIRRHAVVEADPRRDRGNARRPAVLLRARQERPLSVRTTPGPITAMDHVVVSTPDPERAAALYGARLGLDMALDRSHPDWGRLMFFRCGDLIVEVTHRPAKPADPPRDVRHDRLSGICWRVADIDATHARLTEAGVDVSDVRTGRKPGTRVMTVRIRHLRGPDAAGAAVGGEGGLSRHCERSEAIQTFFAALDCFVATLLATGRGRGSFSNPACMLQTILDTTEHLIWPRQNLHRKPALKWQRDPEGMRIRILEAAKQEFAAHGLAGARVDRIAANADANKRMLYYHVGNKEDLYLAVLEAAYDKIRSEERGLDLEHLDPPEAIERLIDFTWNYFIRNPEFLALLNTENLAKARHLKRSTKVKSMHSPFVEMIRTVVTRGVESGDFRVAVDPVQLYISIAGLCFFYLSNSATLSVIFGRDLLKKDARDERLAHMVALVLAALTGKSTADFGKAEVTKLRTPARQAV